MGIKGTDGTFVREQCLKSLPATHLYGAISERRCWQQCSGEVRNSEERGDETESMPCAIPYWYNRFGSCRGISAMGHTDPGDPPVPYPAAHLPK